MRACGEAWALRCLSSVKAGERSLYQSRCGEPQSTHMMTVLLPGRARGGALPCNPIPNVCPAKSLRRVLKPGVPWTDASRAKKSERRSIERGGARLPSPRPIRNNNHALPGPGSTGNTWDARAARGRESPVASGPSAWSLKCTGCRSRRPRTASPLQNPRHRPSPLPNTREPVFARKQSAADGVRASAAVFGFEKWLARAKQSRRQSA